VWERKSAWGGSVTKSSRRVTSEGVVRNVPLKVGRRTAFFDYSPATHAVFQLNGKVYGLAGDFNAVGLAEDHSKESAFTWVARTVYISKAEAALPRDGRADREPPDVHSVHAELLHPGHRGAGQGPGFHGRRRSARRAHRAARRARRGQLRSRRRDLEQRLGVHHRQKERVAAREGACAGGRSRSSSLSPCLPRGACVMPARTCRRPARRPSWRRRGSGRRSCGHSDGSKEGAQRRDVPAPPPGPGELGDVALQ